MSFISNRDHLPLLNLLCLLWMTARLDDARASVRRVWTRTRGSLRTGTMRLEGASCPRTTTAISAQHAVRPSRHSRTRRACPATRRSSRRALSRSQLRSTNRLCSSSKVRRAGARPAGAVFRYTKSPAAGTDAPSRPRSRFRSPVPRITRSRRPHPSCCHKCTTRQ